MGTPIGAFNSERPYRIEKIVLWLIFLIVLSIVVIILGFAVAQRNENETYPVQGLVTVLILMPVLWLAFSFTAVDANSQEVRTSFGKPTGVIGNGPHLVAPWSTGTPFSSARQFIVFKDKPGENEQPRIASRLAGQATADVEGVVSYTQPSSKVIELFRSWKTEDRIRNLFVFQEAKGALQEALGTFDPLAEDKQKEDVYSFYGAEATNKLNARLGGLLEGVKITIGFIDYDTGTDSKLAELQAARAETKVATQKLLTAEQLALANERISRSLSSDPVVAFYQCTAMWTEVVAKMNPVPANFSISGICANTIGAVR